MLQQRPSGIGLPTVLRFLSVVFLNGILLAQNTQIQTVGLQIIVVSSQTDAQAVLNRLQHGADFASMAKELSIDSIAADGGDMGQVDSASLRPEIREALRGIAPGQLTTIAAPAAD